MPGNIDRVGVLGATKSRGSAQDRGVFLQDVHAIKYNITNK